MHATLRSPLRRAMTLALTLVFALAALFVGAPRANANTDGSDNLTPYSVTQAGIQLPAGDTFRDNGHVNIQATGSTWNNLHFEGKCIDRTDAECAGDRHEAAQFIDKDFIPWSAFGLQGEFCVEWVQISHYNQHFGEGGQSPVCVGGPELPTKPDPVVEDTTEERMTCEAGVENRTVHVVTDWILNETSNEYVPSDPVVTFGEWEFVRELTDVESAELECEVAPPPVFEPISDVFAFCDGTGVATFDNSLSNATVSFELIVNGEVVVVRSVEPGDVLTVPFEGAEPGSNVFVQDQDGNELARDTVPEACEEPPLYTSVEISSVCTAENGSMFTVTNPDGNPAVIVLYGDYSEIEPDGEELIESGSSATISTERTTLDIEIISADGWFLEVFEDVAIAHGCSETPRPDSDPDDSVLPQSDNNTVSDVQSVASRSHASENDLLANTGASDWVPMAAVASVLLLLGASFTLMARRRTTS